MKQNRLERLDYLFKKVDRAYRNFDAALDLPHSAVSVYYCLLNQEGSCELGALRAETGVPKQTLNSLLRQLEKEGMLEVRLTEGSYKKKAAILTDKGRKQAENTAGLVMECEKWALASFDEKEAGLLFDLLERFCGELDAQFDEQLAKREGCGDE